MKTKKPTRNIEAELNDKRLVVLEDAALSQVVGGFHVDQDPGDNLAGPKQPGVPLER